MKWQARFRFLARNMFTGLLWLAGIIIVFLLAREYIEIDYEEWIQPLYDQPVVVYLAFLASEIVVGIIPPEMFMIWSTNWEEIHHYVLSVLLLSAISYLAGLVGFWLGSYFKNTGFYRRIHDLFFRKYAIILKRYGSFLVIVASLTPLPFSGIAMLVGASGYSLKKYSLFSLARFLRFWMYGYVIWLTV